MVTYNIMNRIKLAKEESSVDDDIKSEKDINEDKISDDINEIYSKLCNELISTGKFMSFKEIEDIDRIEIGANREEMFKLIKMAYIHNIDTISSFKYHIPFINKGVIKGYDKTGSIYAYFRILRLDINNHILTLRIDAYKLISNTSTFIKLIDFIIQHKYYHDHIEIEMSRPRTGFDRFNSSCDVKSILTDTEYELYKKVYEYQNSEFSILKNKCYNLGSGIGIDKDCNIVEYIYELVIRGTITTNILLEEQRLKYKSYNADPNNKMEVIQCIDPNESRRRKEVIIDAIKIRKGKNSKIRINKGVIMFRRIDVWGVSGHMRHYKNGKTVYINPYKKGPARLIKDPAPKTYKVKTS